MVEQPEQQEKSAEPEKPVGGGAAPEGEPLSGVGSSAPQGEAGRGKKPWIPNWVKYLFGVYVMMPVTLALPVLVRDIRIEDFPTILLVFPWVRSASGWQPATRVFCT